MGGPPEKRLPLDELAIGFGDPLGQYLAPLELRLERIQTDVLAELLMPPIIPEIRIQILSRFEAVAPLVSTRDVERAAFSAGRRPRGFR